MADNVNEQDDKVLNLMKKVINDAKKDDIEIENLISNIINLLGVWGTVYELTGVSNNLTAKHSIAVLELMINYVKIHFEKELAEG